MIIYQRAGWFSGFLFACAISFTIGVDNEEYLFIAAALAAVCNLVFWLILRARNNDHHQTLFFIHLKYWTAILPVLIIVVGSIAS